MLASFALPRPSRNVTNQYFPPPPKIEHLHFGYRWALADILWVRALQDFDFCDLPEAQNLCKANSWLYKMIDGITELDPAFVVAHRAGALALTVIISDTEGASKIFDKSVERFPTSWPILMQAAYHANYEEKNYAKAAALLEKAAKNGGPPWAYSLAARFYTESGRKEFAEKLYEELKGQGFSQDILDRIRIKLQLPKNSSPE